MIVDSSLLDSITEQAKKSPRLRMNYDLRDSADDKSQKMLNALEPGTVLPIHRHPSCSEVVVLLRGKAVQFLYDEQGRQVNAIVMEAGSGTPGMVVEKGQWHRLESLQSGTVILECKEGPYVPISNDDILSI